MKLSDFVIGCEFVNDGGRRWRCTDIGTRTVIAIAIDYVNVDYVDVAGTAVPARRLTGTEAAEAGWFNGPPYAVAEIVIDESDLDGCTPVNRCG